MSIFDKLNASMKASEPQGKPQGMLKHHPNEEAILKAITGLMASSATGKELLDYADNNEIKITLLGMKQEVSYVPSDNTIYLSWPAQDMKGSPRLIIHLTKAIREAIQDVTPGLERPEFNWPQQNHVERTIERDKDQLWHVCAVAHQLIEKHNIIEILDEIEKMGYIDLYKAYKEDLNTSE